MKRTMLYVLAVLLSLSAYASGLSKLDRLGAVHFRSLRGELRNDLSGEKNYAKSKGVKNYTYLPLILKLVDGADPSILAQYDVIVLHNRQNLYLTYVPVEKLEALLENVNIRAAHMGVPESRNMDKARAATMTDEARASNILSVPLDGRGAIVGLSDIGFDPSHVNFLNAEGTSSRVKKMAVYSDFEGTYRIDENPNGLTDVETDNFEYWHATHVTGCMSGSYFENGYSGAAPGADIVATCSKLYDASILSGVEEVINYSIKTGMPSVVNLSVGSYNGPHDGSDLFCQYLDLLGRETIVCISSGNEAIQHSCQAINFTAEKPVFHTAIYDTYYQNGVTMEGFADFWSETDQPFESAICIYDRDAKQMVYESEFSTEKKRLFNENHPEFTKYFSGWVEISTDVDSENSRFTTLYSYNMTSRKMTEIDYAGKLGKYVFGVVLRSTQNLYVEGYTDSTNSIFHSCGIPGWSKGSNFNSVSNIACGHNVIVVGAYNTRNTAPLLDGGQLEYPFVVGENANFSSFGHLIDGRILPHVSGPGNIVVSSMSSAYTDEMVELYGDEFVNTMSAKATVGGKDYYWAATSGTSMSCPIVAGTIAQWLQIYPDMSVEEARAVAMTTGSSDPPRINALEGARLVAQISGVAPLIAANQSRTVVSDLGGNRFRVVMLGAKGMEVAVVSTTGAVVRSLSADSDALDVDLSDLNKGVFLLCVGDANGRDSQKIVIK